ncbi:hypothetical protein [Halobellus marinus]|uniref:hypothetical protein n=1 Tax=Halobellus sp. GCM10025813 TaxID=3252665 RepID=UPI00361998F1
MDENELTDRMSRRFGDQDDNTDDNNSMSSTPSQSETKEQTSQKAQNIKKEWNVRSFYLDDDLNDDLTTAFKRLDFELSESGSDIDLKKTRHFYPLIVRLGLERLEEMEVTEVTEELEKTE